MQRGRILVADENPDILRLVEVNLNSEDYETLVARNGQEALSITRREAPDLVIVDLMLPGLDGWQVLRKLKADPRTAHIPVILMMSGSALRDGREGDLGHGVAAYLSKPFNPLRLLDVVHEHTKSSLPQRTPLTRVERSTRVVLLLADDSGTELLKNLLGNATLDVIAVIGEPIAEGVVLARELNIQTFRCLDELDESIPVHLFIDTRHRSGHALVDPELSRHATAHAAEILTGRTLEFLRGLVAEHVASHRKEQDLVAELQERIEELSIINEMARIVSSPFDIRELYKRTLNLTLRVAGLSGGSVLIYDKHPERFVPVARVGLSERFEAQARLPLSDPLVDEVLTLRRPLHIKQVDGSYPSALMNAAARESLASMLALPIAVKDKVIGLLVVGTRHSHAFREQEIVLLSGLATQMGMVIENAHLHQTSHQKQVLIEQLLGKVIQAQEDERKRLAAEIHDSVAQSLAGVLTQIQICGSLLSTGQQQQVAEQLQSMRQNLAGSVREVRQIIFDLRPSSLDDLGLIPSIENYIKRFERENKIAVTLVVDNMPPRRLHPNLETTLFRLVQESLTNVKKHAHASSVQVSLSSDGYQVSLKIVDDGQGFRWPEVTDKFFRGESHGVEGMKERVALMGGTFRIYTQEGAGTVVRVDIPVRTHSSEKVDASSASLIVESSALSAVSSVLAQIGSNDPHETGIPSDLVPQAQASRKERIDSRTDPL